MNTFSMIANLEYEQLFLIYYASVIQGEDRQVNDTLLCSGGPLVVFPHTAAVMGEYEPKIEVQFPESLHIPKGSSVKLECFALGK